MNNINSLRGRTYGQTENLSSIAEDQNKISKETEVKKESQIERDNFTKTEPMPKVTYSPMQTAKKVRSESDARILNDAFEQLRQTESAFKQMLVGMLKNQANYHNGDPIYLNDLDLTKVGVPQAAADEIQRLSAKYGNVEATDAVGENDFWGVNQTAQRIFDFAVSLSGGDKDKLEMLKNSVMKGFKEAENLFGGSLPDISYQTLDKINELFDNYDNAE